MQPLHGIRVLSVESYGAGPYGTMHLADLGAEVIKIEAPARGKIAPGDSARHAGPFFLGPNDSQFFQSFNRNKRSVVLDLHHPDGYAAFLKLAARADAVMNNLRGDQPGKLRLAYNDLKGANPRLVCAHLSGYGRTGPRAGWPAYDYLAQSEAGYLHLTGEPDGPPTRMGLSVIDFMSGVTMAFALAAALLGAFRSGRGCDVDVTLYDVAMHQLTYLATWYMNAGQAAERRPRSGHPTIVPCEMFPTADGWLFIMCMTPKFWIALCERLGRPELAADPRFRGFAERFANRDALADILDGEFRRATTGAWMQRLGGRVPAAPVLTLPQALDNPHFHQTEGVLTLAHKQRPDLKMIAAPIRIDGRRPAAAAGPALGADTEALLLEAGCSAADIASLRAEGAI
ncbi:MAG TPA: CoA transferase [Acetobacteraceae bacterium]|nr:CoA transferase [Acetobacteraceae bacterium]